MKQAIFNKMNFTPTYDDANDERASYLGISIKTIVLLLVMIGSAAASMLLLSRITSEDVLGIYLSVLFVALIASVITSLMCVSERLSLVAGFIFSISTGVLLGAISKLLELVIPGISILAVISTLVVFLVVYLLFSTGVLRATSKLFAALISILGCAMALGLVTFFMSFFFDYGELLPVLILIQAFYVLYGSISLIYNFEDAKMHVDAGLSKRSEWQVAFGFIITIYYIYIEILRLLMYILPYIIKAKK